MKKVLLTAALTAVSLVANAQNEKGWFADSSSPERVNRLLKFMEVSTTSGEVIGYAGRANASSDPAPITSAAKKKTGCEFDGRVGTVHVTNNSLYPVTVYLMHPDSGKQWPAAGYGWRVPGTETLTITFNGEMPTVGSDWGLRLGDSPMRCIGSASTWDWQQRQFQVSTDQFFRD